MTISLSDSIQAFPIRHGKAVFAMELRKKLWSEKFDAIAFAFPASLGEDILIGIESLPAIGALAIHVDDELRAYLPFDPSDAYIEALRQGQQKRLPMHFLEDDTLLEGPFLQPLPDAYLVTGIGIEKYYEISKTILAGLEKDDRLKHRTEIAYNQLKKLSATYKKILFICDFPILIELEGKFRELKNGAANLHFSNTSDQNNSDHTIANQILSDLTIEYYPIKPSLLYFALGEIPFYAGEMEKERQNPFAEPLDYFDLVKRIFVETRNQFLTDKNEAWAISIKKIQSALIFLRNLAIVQKKLSPDLLDIVSAAKGVFGNAFAAKVLEAARFYPFIDPLQNPDSQLEIGRQFIHIPGEENPQPAFNLLEDEPKVWKTIHLKKEPTRQKQKDFRYAWDARGMCSHTPEDMRIEGFNQSIRRRSQDLDLQAHARAEKLSTSLKDGIDIRETLRNWTSGEIYVKEIPPAKGRMDTVVIIFDDEHDERYTSRTTWYAEHPEESTLTFFATDPLSKMIGPGIAECEYGGLSLLFPPRPVKDIFSIPPEAMGFQSAAEQLVYGALLNSKEKSIAYVSHRKPGLRMKGMAAKLHRRLIWIPLTSFSAETILKLRKFHILNGKQVRAWASRFIPD